jgi:hypothetical protein
LNETSVVYFTPWLITKKLREEECRVEWQYLDVGVVVEQVAYLFNLVAVRDGGEGRKLVPNPVAWSIHSTLRP